MTDDPLVLLVEDNADDELLTLGALSPAVPRDRIAVARDGQQALDFLLGDNAPRRRPVVVLLDLKLPRISGIDVLRRLRESPRTRTLPVVILTSSSQDADLAASYAGGANSYVRKPVDFRDFASAVERLGVYWLGLNHPPPEERG